MRVVRSQPGPAAHGSGVGWGAGDSGGKEASPAWWGLRVYGEAFLVDDDVVVEPAQQRQPVGFMSSAPATGPEVVWFEAVAAGAPVSGAAPVTEEDKVTYPVG